MTVCTYTSASGYAQIQNHKTLFHFLIFIFLKRFILNFYQIYLFTLFRKESIEKLRP